MKLSWDSKENCRVLKQLKYNIAFSDTLTLLHLIGFQIRDDGWTSLSQGLGKTNTLKRLLIQNTNLAEKNHLQLLSKGLAKTLVIEYVDLQYNNLNDSHTITLKYIIKQQFELKEDLKWRLGLRNPIDVNTTSLGIKFLNLNHNKLGDHFAF